MGVTEALIPVVLCIACGYLFRKYGKVATTSWDQFGHLTYYLLMPALEIKVLANADLEALPWAPLLISVLTLLAAFTALMVSWQHWVRPQSGKSFTSLYQGGIRFNTFIALVLGGQLLGNAGLAAVAIVAAVMILVVNILCVLAFSLYVGTVRIRAEKLLTDLVTNPLIAGCVIGLGLNMSGIGLGGAAESFFRLMGNAALPVGLMVVGAALHPHHLRGNWEVITTASIIQLILKPVAAVGAVTLAGLDGVLASAVLICFVVPTAPSAYVLALQKGGDANTMAAIITLQTIIAAISIPVMMHVQRMLGAF